MSRIPLPDIEAALPRQGLFKDKVWLLSPEPLALESAIIDELEVLGALLAKFAVKANNLYFASRDQSAPGWISRALDSGKPQSIVELGCSATFRNEVPRLIRPDVLLTDDGLKVTEIDSLPGGIGLTAWLNQLYSDFGWPVVGGGRGMIDGFERVLDSGKVFISREAQDYRPEMEWILAQMDSTEGKVEERLVDTWKYDLMRDKTKTAYRYFELWDLDNVENVSAFERLAVSGETVFTPPMKAFFEEKLWLALLWSPGLRAQWSETLGSEGFERFRQFVPQGWILDPAPIPHFAEYPGLGIQNWDELKAFSQKDRRLVLKISGFSQQAWGSRGVYIGHDLPGHEWRQVIDRALEQFPDAPHILQIFHQAKIIEHPFYDRDTGEVRIMNGRARLCPYYFVGENRVTLAGILAAICPKDKKLIHGMTDAILVPCMRA